MADAKNEITEDIVRFTSRQIERLAQAASVSMDEVRRAQRLMPMKNDFLLSLGYVHMQRDPSVANIQDPRRRHLAAHRGAIDLRSVWEGDATVQSIMAVARQQASTGKVIKDEPSKFMGWIERVWSNQPSAAPSPAMSR